MRLTYLVEFETDTLSSAAILERQLNGVCEPVVPEGFNHLLTTGSLLELLESYWAVDCNCRNVANRLTDADCDLCKKVRPILQAAGVLQHASAISALRALTAE